MARGGAVRCGAVTPIDGDKEGGPLSIHRPECSTVLDTGRFVLGALNRDERDCEWVSLAWDRAAAAARSTLFGLRSLPAIAGPRRWARAAAAARSNHELAVLATKAADAIRACSASRRLVVLHQAGEWRAVWQRDRCERRGCPSCERRRRRHGVARLLPLAESAANDRRLTYFTGTHSDREGESYTAARERLAKSWGRFTRSPAFRRSFVGGNIGDDRTWSTPESRRTAKARVLARTQLDDPGRWREVVELVPLDLDGSWWHFHLNGVAEQRSYRLPGEPRGDGAKFDPSYAQRLKLEAVEHADLHPKSRAAAFARWLRERPDGKTTEDLCGEEPSPYEERFVSNARKWARARFLRTAAEDNGVYFWFQSVSNRARFEGRTVRGAVFESVKYSASRGSIPDLDRMAEVLQAQRGAQLTRLFGRWRTELDRETDEHKAMRADLIWGDDDDPPEHLTRAELAAVEAAGDAAGTVAPKAQIVASWTVPTTTVLEPLQAAALVLVLEGALRRGAAWADRVIERENRCGPVPLLVEKRNAWRLEAIAEVRTRARSMLAARWEGYPVHPEAPEDPEEPQEPQEPQERAGQVPWSVRELDSLSARPVPPMQDLGWW